MIEIIGNKYKKRSKTKSKQLLLEKFDCNWNHKSKSNKRKQFCNLFTKRNKKKLFENFEINSIIKNLSSKKLFIKQI